jgi:O-antigen/teichoic acid export membrane protein
MLRSLALQSFVISSANMLFGVMASILLSRWLGPTLRGEIQAAILWPLLLGYLGSMGMVPATLYFTSLPGANVRAILGNALAFAVIQTAAAVVLGVVIIPRVLVSQTPEVIEASQLYLAIVPLILTTRYFLTVLHGMMKIATVNWLRAIVPTGYLVGILALALADCLKLSWILGLNITLQSLLLVFLVMVMKRAGLRICRRFDQVLATRMWDYARQVQVGDFAQAINLRVDQVLIAGFLPPKHLAFYAIAVSCAAMSQALCEAVKMVVTPSVSSKRTPQEATALLELAFRKYWLVSVVGILFLAIRIPSLIPFLLGDRFQPVLLLAGLFGGAKDVLSGGAQALDSPFLCARAELVALVVTVSLLLLLLPTMGIMGAAVASAVAYMAQLVVIAHGLHQQHQIAPGALFRVQLRDVIALPVDLATAVTRLYTRNA